MHQLVTSMETQTACNCVNLKLFLEIRLPTLLCSGQCHSGSCRSLIFCNITPWKGVFFPYILIQQTPWTCQSWISGVYETRYRIGQRRIFCFWCISFCKTWVANWRASSHLWCYYNNLCECASTVTTVWTNKSDLATCNLQ